MQSPDLAARFGKGLDGLHALDAGYKSRVEVEPAEGCE